MIRRCSASSRNKAFLFILGVTGSVTLFASVSLADFTDVTDMAGLTAPPTQSWGNPIWGDTNNDGYPDLIIPTHSSQPLVYRNNGDGTFTDISPAGIVPPDGKNADWRGFSFGDYDSDGNLDLFVAVNSNGTKASNLLFKGNGDGTFTLVTNAGSDFNTPTEMGQAGFWADFDNDGKLNLFVKNYADVNLLFRRNGNGIFVSLPNAAGLSKATSFAPGDDYHGTICSFADYDNDGDMDAVFSGERNALYRCTNGNYVDVSTTAGIPALDSGKGIAWGDYNNDGFLDLYVSRGVTEFGQFLGNTLYKNNGNGTFTDVTQAAGLASTANCWSAVWGDYDNDGFLDLFVTCIAGEGATTFGEGNANFLYHNNGDGTFTDVAAAEGVALEDDQITSLHKTSAWADYNNDGFLDLIIKDGVGPGTGAGLTGIHRLLRNNGNGNHYIKVNLVGVQSNLRGIGARVTVRTAGLNRFQLNNGGGGGDYASQGSEPLHFGIGSARKATITVRWPSGTVDTVNGVHANQTITIVEGSHSLQEDGAN